MTSLLRPLAPVMALLMLLTFLLLRGTAPDLGGQQRRLDLIDAIILDQAALERDALQVRAGLLANYDPLVDGVTRMRSNLAALEADRPRWPDMPELLTTLRQVIANQEIVIERIKSSNAQVSNSLAYFAYLVQQEGFTRGGIDQHLVDLSTEMLRFTRSAEAADAADIYRALYEVQTEVDDDEVLAPIVDHARVILDGMSVMGDSLAVLGASPVEHAATALRASLVRHYREQDAMATIYHGLLYLVAISLLGYLFWLFLKLRRNVATLDRHTGTLERRSAAQAALAQLSTSFIDIPAERIDAAIEQGLATLGRQLRADRAYLVTAQEGSAGARALVWCSDRRPASPAWPCCSLDLLDDPDLQRGERDGCIVIPSTMDLPPGRVLTALEQQDVRGWFGVPLWRGGERVGLLGFDLAEADPAWSSDNLQHLRMAGDIFAHALERRHGELERQALTIRLAQAERMQAIGTLAGGIAHNFNNILGAILGHTEMAFESVGPASQIRRHLEGVRKAGTRAKILVDQILTFGRRTERTRTPVHLASLLSETLGLLDAVLPSTVTVATDIADRDATVLGDPAQLQQVVMNLCTNAAQAMSGVGRIDVSVSIAACQEERTLSHGTAPSGRFVRLAVGDQGHGIDQATMPRIFEPFFTTKLAGRGTGLGLATVHGIVVDHQGALNVTSRPGHRTEFEIFLPAIQSATPAPRPASGATIRGAGQVILLVDDEEPLLLLCEEMLAALGYEPVGFTDPARALEVFRADPARFDLVLSDEVMPGLMGDQLASEIAGIRPGLPVLLMTGYGGLVAAERLRALGVREVLHKPLVPSDLALAMGRHLEPPSSRSAA